jgi:hypothetical protein
MHVSLSRTHFIKEFELTNINVVVDSPLDSKSLDSCYPPVGMPFYLYGSSEDEEYHIDHTYVAAPNIQLSGGEVTIDVSSGTLPTFTDDSPYVEIIATEYQERVMQPFPPNKDIDKNQFFFSPGKVLAFDINDSQGNQVAQGTLTLTENSFVDTDMLNEDPVPDTQEEVPDTQVDPVPIIPHRGPVPNAPRHVPTPHVPIAHHVSARDHAISRGRGWQDLIVGASPLL